jgi:Mn-dependent DtxR family transcriptional regulator
MAASTSSMGRTSSQDGDLPQVSSKSLKFIYEPKHCRQDEEFNQRVNDALKQYKAEIHKTLEPLADSGLVSRSDSSSLINTGKDTASARD